MRFGVDVSADVEADRLITEALGASVVRSRPLGGGMIGSVRRVEVDDGRTVVAKTSPGGGLEVEAFMLRALGERSPLPVPEVLIGRDDLLVMEHLPGSTGAGSAGAQRHLAELLAETHAVEGSAFGFERDTRLGPFDLPNPWTEDGSVFFRDQRLRWALGLAEASDALPREDRQRVERVAERAPELLAGHAGRPVLLHGDLWSGNVLSDGDRITGVIDPAVHHGDAETELAFIDLFGGVGEPFWNRYRELRTLDDAFFAWRRSLWQLVPLLVHVALFGGGYVPPTRRRLDAIEKVPPETNGA